MPCALTHSWRFCSNPYGGGRTVPSEGTGQTKGHFFGKSKRSSKMRGWEEVGLRPLQINYKALIFFLS